MNNTAVKVENISIQYPHATNPVVEAVSFEVQENTIATILGPNGAGKSTIIKALLGLIPHSGTITIFGQNQKQGLDNVGYVPQRYNFDSSIPITVDEFLSLALVACHHSRSEKSKMKSDVLTKVNMHNFLEVQLRELSGGQIQRILLARALVHSPKLLILDEPEAGIDVSAEQSMYDLLVKLRDEDHITTIIASHELDVVYGYADQVICVNKRLVCAGKPNTTLTKDTFIKLYGGDIQFYTHGHKKK